MAQKTNKMKTVISLVAIAFFALSSISTCRADEGVNLSVQVVARRADQTINDFDFSSLKGETLLSQEPSEKTRRSALERILKSARNIGQFIVQSSVALANG